MAIEQKMQQPESWEPCSLNADAINQFNKVKAECSTGQSGCEFVPSIISGDVMAACIGLPEYGDFRFLTIGADEAEWVFAASSTSTETMVHFYDENARVQTPNGDMVVVPVFRNAPVTIVVKYENITIPVTWHSLALEDLTALVAIPELSCLSLIAKVPRSVELFLDGQSLSSDRLFEDPLLRTTVQVTSSPHVLSAVSCGESGGCRLLYRETIFGAGDFPSGSHNLCQRIHLSLPEERKILVIPGTVAPSCNGLMIGTRNELTALARNYLETNPYESLSLDVTRSDRFIAGLTFKDIGDAIRGEQTAHGKHPKSPEWTALVRGAWRGGVAYILTLDLQCTATATGDWLYSVHGTNFSLEEAMMPRDVLGNNATEQLTRSTHELVGQANYLETAVQISLDRLFSVSYARIVAENDRPRYKGRYQFDAAISDKVEGELSLAVQHLGNQTSSSARRRQSPYVCRSLHGTQSQRAKILEELAADMSGRDVDEGVPLRSYGKRSTARGAISSVTHYADARLTKPGWYLVMLLIDGELKDSTCVEYVSPTLEWSFGVDYATGNVGSGVGPAAPGGRAELLFLPRKIPRVHPGVFVGYRFRRLNYDYILNNTIWAPDYDSIDGRYSSVDWDTHSILIGMILEVRTLDIFQSQLDYFVHQGAPEFYWRAAPFISFDIIDSGRVAIDETIVRVDRNGTHRDERYLFDVDVGVSTELGISLIGKRIKADLIFLRLELAGADKKQEYTLWDNSGLTVGGGVRVGGRK